MSQIWNIPIDVTDLLSDSRVDINDAFASLRTHFLGTSDPSVLEDGMLWINTTANQLKARKSGVTKVLGIFDTEMGHVKSAGDTMTGDLDFGGTKNVKGLADPGSNLNWAARVNELLGKVSKAGDTMSGFLILHSDPTSNNHASTKAYADTKASRAGDTLTGRLTNVGAPAPGNDDLVTKAEVASVTFNTVSGHDHDGTDSKKVETVNLATTSLAANKVPISTGGGGVSMYTLRQPIAFNYPTTTLDSYGGSSWREVDLSGITAADAYAALIVVDGNSSAGALFRASGLGADDPDMVIAPLSGSNVMIIVELSVTRKFEWRNTGSISARAIRFFGYFRQVLSA